MNLTMDLTTWLIIGILSLPVGAYLIEVYKVLRKKRK